MAQSIEEVLQNVDRNTLERIRLRISFALILKDELKKEFETVHLSKQLYHSIRIFVDENGKIHVIIPAQLYDVGYYRKRGVIKHISQNSYALAVNYYGGFSGTHKDYVTKCIQRTINRWKSENNIKIERLNTKINKR